jgi:hypothetical protein
MNLLLGLGLGSLSETVLESARHRLKVLAATGASGDSSLALLRPLVRATFGRRVGAGTASSLLLVEGDLSTTATCRVGHGLAHAERLSSLCLLGLEKR